MTTLALILLFSLVYVGVVVLVFWPFLRAAGKDRDSYDK